MPSRFDLGPKPRLGYADSRLERASELRITGAQVAGLTEKNNAGAYLAAGEMIVMKRGAPLHDPLFTLEEARILGASTELLFLGTLDGAGRFALGLAPAVADALKERGDLAISDLRSVAVQGLVDAIHLPPMAEAKAMLHWHARHRYCANCGAQTRVTQCGWRRDCPQCNAQHFPRTDPVVIMLAVNGSRCLLGRSARFAPTMWSCLAGFVEPGESFEDAVRRETHEEAGIVCGEVRYFASQPWPFPSSLMIGCYAEALSEEIIVDRAELEDARWFEKEEAATMLMRRHHAGLTAPPPVAIAYHILRGWLEEEVSFD